MIIDPPWRIDGTPKVGSLGLRIDPDGYAEMVLSKEQVEVAVAAS